MIHPKILRQREGRYAPKDRNLPNATRMAEQVICLPMHHGLSEEDIQRVLKLI